MERTLFGPKRTRTMFGGLGEGGGRLRMGGWEGLELAGGLAIVGCRDRL